MTWSTDDPELQHQSQSHALQTRGGGRLIPSASASSSETTPSSPAVPSVVFAPSMAVYEALPGRKWKQRCDFCGTPMGSWNEAKKE